jgi:hypothetical protein
VADLPVFGFASQNRDGPALAGGEERVVERGLPMVYVAASSSDLSLKPMAALEKKYPA